MASVKLVVFQVILLFWSFSDPLLTVEAQPGTWTKPGCEYYCGNVSIPYPFGMNAGCYLEERYKISCRKSRTGGLVPTLSINGTDLVVTDSTYFLDGTVTVDFPIVFANCRGKERNNTVVDLEGTPFVFSSSMNYFIATGCQNLAVLTQNEATVGGCMSSCDHNKGDGNGMMDSCSGIKCCQTSIPSDLKVFNVTLRGLDDGRGRSGVKECWRAFLFCRYYYSSDDATDAIKSAINRGYAPVVLEWGIDSELFETLVKNGSFDNSSYSTRCEVQNPPLNSTVRCSCQPGFQGNPYLGYCEAEGPVYHEYRKDIRAKMAGLGIGVGFGALIILTGLWRLYKVFKRRRKENLKKKYFKRNGGLLLQEQLSSGEINVEKIKMFSAKELDKATYHYNVNRMLGHGGQGTVYKGMLVDGKIIAVKKSKILDESNLKQFINEVVILSQINHRNVVRLLGCCLETEVPLLVYEFIPNGTLFQFLHEPNEEIPLTWEVRLRMATEVAGALYYIHSAASIPIYHRDIKSTNILLDEKYRAKVADFGTSRTVTIDQTHVTTLVQGTFGYLDPEYFQSSQFTDKSDVYSFGVVLVELLTGQKPISFTRSEQEGRSLVTYFLMAMETNLLFDILDPKVMMQIKKEDVMMVATLAKNCLRLNGKERPTMKEVTIVLEGILKSSKDLIIPQETGYDRNEVMEAPWVDFASTSMSSELGTGFVSVKDTKPLFHTQ